MHLRIPKDSCANYLNLRVLPYMIILCVAMYIAKCEAFNPPFHRAFNVIWKTFGNSNPRVILHYIMLS